MKIGIIGGGSVGLLLSSFLSQKHKITIYVKREEQKLALNKHGLVNDGTRIPNLINVLTIHEMKNEDCLFICVKQADIIDVLPLIKQENHQTPVFFLQNGMGHLRFIKNIKQPCFVGVVEHGAYRINDYSVKHTGKGMIKIAVFNGKKNKLKELVSELTAEDFPIVKESDWRNLLAKKLIINAVINPLTALFDVKNGYVLTNTYLQKLARKLCAEACLVLNLDYLEQWNRVQDVADKTADNISSMLNDIRNGVKTENEAISGYLLAESKEHIPYTTFIYNSIKVLETKKGNYAEYH